MNHRILITLIALAMPVIAMGQANEAKSKVLRLKPAAAPSPALRYELLPSAYEETPGDAAGHYLNFLAHIKGKDSKISFSNEQWKWIKAPLEKLPMKKVRQKLLSDTEFELLESASRYEQCLWPTNIHIRKHGFSTLLPAIGSMRDIARALSLRARVQTKDGQFDQAVRTIKVGMAMARHLEEGSTLIEGLVGIAIAQMMLDRIEELIQHKSGPNLYWALTELPRPMVSLRRGLRYERQALRFTLPKLYEMTEKSYSKEAWQAFMSDAILSWQDIHGLVGVGSGPQDQNEFRMGIALFSAVRYPLAKRYMVAQGMTEQQVEAMPVTQVVLMYETDRFQHWSDETFKWFNLPYWQAEPGMQKTERAFIAAAARKESILAKLLLPAISSAVRNQVLLDQRLASIQIVEAIRMHAAANEGKLPESLSSITVVPVPLDPVSGKSFDYKIEDGTARLTGKQPATKRTSQGQLKLEIHMQ